MEGRQRGRGGGAGCNLGEARHAPACRRRGGAWTENTRESQTQLLTPSPDPAGRAPRQAPPWWALFFYLRNEGVGQAR